VGSLTGMGEKGGNGEREDWLSVVCGSVPIQRCHIVDSSKLKFYEVAS
jgi:hypothetical protein